MKRILSLIMLVILSVSISACSLINNDDKVSNFFDNAVDNTLDEKISFTKEVSSFDKIELNVDLTVSDVKIEVSNDRQLKYNQAANREELLASVDYTEKGDTLVVTYKNEKRINIISGSQTSKTEILIPEGIEVILDTNVDVGDVVVNAKNIFYTEITSNTNVGDITIISSKEQDQLSYISVSSDVGDLFVSIDKGAKSLDTVKLKTNTGSVKASFEGDYEKSIKITSRIDVGDTKIEAQGNFDKDIDMELKSSVGDVTISVPKGHAIKLIPTLTEFTSSLELSGIPFDKTKGEYNLNGKKSLFEIDMSVTVGDAKILYSK